MANSNQARESESSLAQTSLPGWRLFFPYREKSILFAWMAATLLIILVIYLSFENNDTYHWATGIYTMVTTPFFMLIVIWVFHTIATTPCERRFDEHYYSKPISWILHMTIWGCVMGRIAMSSFKIFCYFDGHCHYPLVETTRVLEVFGGVLDDFTDIVVILSFYAYVRHTMKHKFLKNGYRFHLLKHLILAVLILLFFQIGAKETHELVEEEKRVYLGSKPHFGTPIEQAIEFMAPFTFLLTTEIIGLLFGLAFVMPISEKKKKKEIADDDASEITTGTPMPKRKSGVSTTRLLSIPVLSYRSVSVPTLTNLKVDHAFKRDEDNISSDDNSEEPDESLEEITIPVPHIQPSTQNPAQNPTEGSAEEGPDVIKRVIRSLVKMSFPPDLFPKFSKTPKRNNLKRNSEAILVIILSGFLFLASAADIFHKTFVYGRFEESKYSVEVRKHSTGEIINRTFMGSDKEISDFIGAASNFLATSLFLLLIHKLLSDIRYRDYLPKKDEHHSKIDKLFLFFTAILWTITIGIDVAAHFVPSETKKEHFGLTQIQKISALTRNIVLLFGMWLQLIVLHILLSIRLPQKIDRRSRLHHWALIISLHAALFFDCVEWFTFFLNQQFTKHLLPFYPSTLLIPARLLTPYIGMFLFHAICCWVIVRVRFRRRGFFNFGPSNKTVTTITVTAETCPSELKLTIPG